MGRYETLREETMTFGANGYLELARKRLVEGDEATEFLLLTRGFLDAQGEKRWTRFVTLPDEHQAREWLVEALRRV